MNNHCPVDTHQTPDVAPDDDDDFDYVDAFTLHTQTAARDLYDANTTVEVLARSLRENDVYNFNLPRIRKLVETLNQVLPLLSK